MKKGKRLSKGKTIFRLCILFILVSIVTIYYFSRFISPDEYKITNKEIVSSNLSDSITGLRVAFISDINLKNQEDVDRLKNIVNTMNKQSYDIVIFGGDLYDTTPFNDINVINILKDIKSSYGKFAVQGEKDLLYSNDVISILNDSGFEVLHNEYRKIHYKDTAFALFGLENNGEVSSLINDDNREMFKLVIVHQPDFFSQTITQNIDLQLSGHSMGGYINIPLLGPVFKKTNAETFVNGTYKKDTSTLIISNGIGMESSQDFRLFCPNEILSISLKGTKKVVPEEKTTEENPQKETPTEQ